jgi:hypothetical protein
VNDLRPIETRYAGYRFRSRLEARWAVFFDALGIKWDYEPQGYHLKGNRHYLPDFWLPQVSMFAEIKGQVFSDEERECCRLLAEASGHSVLMLDGLPELRSYWAYSPPGIEPECPLLLDYELAEGHRYWETENRFYSWCGPSWPEVEWYQNDLGSLAVDAARSARFEHGEGQRQERLEIPRYEIPIRRVVRRERTHGRGVSAEHDLIRSLLKNPTTRESIAERVSPESFTDPVYREIYSAFIETLSGELSDVLSKLQPTARAFAEQTLMLEEFVVDPHRTLEDAFTTIRIREIEQRVAEIDRLFIVADLVERDRLFAERQELIQEMRETGKMSFKAFRRSRSR